MPVEIERKFLVIGDAWRDGASGKTFRQGYLPAAPGCSVRVRIAEDAAWLALKGDTHGMSRPEYEYRIPVVEATEIMDILCRQPVIEKTRYLVGYHGMTWEIDVFAGANDGLVVAEIELEHESQAFDRPEWVGAEVTGDPRYYNASLAVEPYSAWKSC